MSEPEVNEITTRGERVFVTYTDGCTAIFEPYKHGWGFQIEGLRHFQLSREEEVVCRLNGRLHYGGPIDDEYCIVNLDPSYTQQEVSVYWTVAKKWLNENYSDKLWYSLKVVEEGWLLLKYLEEGSLKGPVSNSKI